MVRLKHRYLLLNILYPDPNTQTTHTTLPLTLQFHRPTSDALTPQLLLRALRDQISSIFGEYGSGVLSSSLQVKYLSTATSTAILRVSRDHYRLAWAALSYITHLPRPINEACVIQVVRVSGTIRKSEEEAIARAKQSILRAQRASAASGTVVTG